MHPSPQLARTPWLDLRGPWAFAYDDGALGVRDGWPDSPAPFDRTIVVPFPPESPLSGIGDRSQHDVVWYRRTFRLSELGRPRTDSRLILRFGAVDYEAQVWVNGADVGSHEGGHSSFALDVTDALRDGDEQVIAVRAEDRMRDLTQPRGKQAWELEPAEIWYHRTTGIWQPVWLEWAGPTSVDALAWRTSTGGVIGLEWRLSAEPPRGTRARVRLSRDGTALAAASFAATGRDLRGELRIDRDPASLAELLWRPSNPVLLDAEVAVESANGDVLDRVTSYVGIREVGASGGLVTINGTPLFLRLVLEQGYWPASHLAAPGDQAIRDELEAVRALGFNGVRIHQKVEDPRFLYWCDRLGLVVWGEMANAQAFSPDAVRRFTAEWLEVVGRDQSHPSIVAWVPFNESWGVPDLANDPAQRAFVRSIHDRTRELDPTRPVIGNDGWEHVVGDLWGIHDYAQDGPTLRRRYGTADAIEQTLVGDELPKRLAVSDARHRGEPILLTEYGGISLDPDGSDGWDGYGSVPDADALVARYGELTTALLDSSGLAGFCYTQLTDTEQERNGLLRADRTPKMEVTRIAEINRRRSRAERG
jgi:beta-galactosidase/beta-glucuronidase